MLPYCIWERAYRDGFPLRPNRRPVWLFRRTERPEKCQSGWQEVTASENANRHVTVGGAAVLPAGVDDERIRQIRKAGKVKGQADFSTKTPHLILTLLPSDRVDNPTTKSRRKRAAATEPSTCSR